MASPTNGAAGLQSPPRGTGHPTEPADPTLDTLLLAIAASRGCSVETALRRIHEHGAAAAITEVTEP